MALLRRGCPLPVSVLYMDAWLNRCIRFRVGRLEAVIFNLLSPNDSIAGCCFLLVLPVGSSWVGKRVRDVILCGGCGMWVDQKL